MRRFAACVVVKDVATSCINHVVETDNGIIVNDHPLVRETEAVEWIGGMIVCSPYRTIDKFNKIKISDFIKRYSSQIYSKDLYPWYISDVDISIDSVITDRNLSLLK